MALCRPMLHGLSKINIPLYFLITNYNFYFIIWQCHLVCGILVPQQESNPRIPCSGCAGVQMTGSPGKLELKYPSLNNHIFQKLLKIVFHFLKNFPSIFLFVKLEVMITSSLRGISLGLQRLNQPNQNQTKPGCLKECMFLQVENETFCVFDGKSTENLSSLSLENKCLFFLSPKPKAVDFFHLQNFSSSQAETFLIKHLYSTTFPTQPQPLFYFQPHYSIFNLYEVTYSRKLIYRWNITICPFVLVHTA